MLLFSTEPVVLSAMCAWVAIMVLQVASMGVPRGSQANPDPWNFSKLPKSSPVRAWSVSGVWIFLHHAEKTIVRLPELAPLMSQACACSLVLRRLRTFSLSQLPLQDITDLPPFWKCSWLHRQGHHQFSPTAVVLSGVPDVWCASKVVNIWP